MIEDKKSINEKEAFDKFLSEFAKTTKSPMIKSMDSSNRAINKLRDLISEEKRDDDIYYKNVYNFLEQLNKLIDDFIKEHK